MRKSELKQLIKEEISKILNETQYNQLELTTTDELLLNYLNSDIESNKPIKINQSKNNEFKRIQELAGIQLNENSFKKEEYKYLKISPEKFKIGDLFLMAPEDGGEFFNHKEATKILSITLPKDGRGNTALIKTEEGDKKLSDISLYHIARKKS